jgi:hypothetical protein
MGIGLTCERVEISKRLVRHRQGRRRDRREGALSRRISPGPTGRLQTTRADVKMCAASPISLLSCANVLFE